MNNVNWDFMDRVYFEVGYSYGNALEEFIKDSLQQRFIGRMIVWSMNHKKLKIAKFLSSVVDLQIEIQKNPSMVSEKWRVIYGAKCISEGYYNTIMNIIP